MNKYVYCSFCLLLRAIYCLVIYCICYIVYCIIHFYLSLTYTYMIRLYYIICDYYKYMFICINLFLFVYIRGGCMCIYVVYICIYSRCIYLVYILYTFMYKSIIITIYNLFNMTGYIVL